MMEPYESNTSWSEIAGRIRGAGRIAIATHERPDGDALGSVLALHRALTQLGKNADAIVMGAIERSLLAIVRDTPLRLVEKDPPGDDYDAIIVVDTGAWSQLEPIAGWLRGRREKTIVIDHHARGDDVGALRIIDSGAAAAASLVADLLDELECPLTAAIAEPLFVGLATDTGWFRYSNAGPDALELAARLMRAGADKSRLFQLIEETHRPERLALEARALASVVFTGDGTVAIQSISQVDFDETGTTPDDLTGLVNLPMEVGSVRAAVLLAEIGPVRTKASFRSKPGTDGTPAIDVNDLARRFKGGGHVFASGAKIGLSLRDAREAVIAAVGESAVVSEQ